MDHPLKKYLTNNSIKNLENFSEKIGISTRMLYYYFNFEKYPSRSTALKISAITGISVTDLLYPAETEEES